MKIRRIEVEQALSTEEIDTLASSCSSCGLSEVISAPFSMAIFVGERKQLQNSVLTRRRRMDKGDKI